MVNEGRMLAVLGVINLNPERHEQAYWACGTARCFGGWAVDLFSGLPLKAGHNSFYAPASAGVEEEYVSRSSLYDSWVMRGGAIQYLYAGAPGGAGLLPGEEEYVPLNCALLARDLLGLSEDDAESLFNANNTLEEVNHIALGIMTGTEYTCGYDCLCDKCDVCECGDCIGEEY